VSGGCPAIRFVVNGTTVVANSSTEYRKGNCKHVQQGARVVVVGTRNQDGTVTAGRVDIVKRADEVVRLMPLGRLHV
jgi:hypothetical protein